MEKLVYALSLQEGKAADALVAELQAEGARHIRINLRDAAVAAGDTLVQSRGESLPDCVVQFWLPSGNPAFRAGIDAALAAASSTMRGWLVSEATIIANDSHPARPGERTPGFAQLAFLTLPDGMGWQDWRAIWRDFHTQVAIETQSNFEYVQNLVVEPLTDTGEDIVAIVEECFPEDALTDPLAFFDAVGDPQKFKANLDRMMDSCARFITPGTIDVFLTSQYDFAD